MVQSYRTVRNQSQIELVIKKSRFIVKCFPVLNEDQATGELTTIRKQFWDATHHCYAYIVGQDGIIERFSDDGEPSGTAGKPILEVLRNENIRDTMVVVTRYFGGVLLGTGGLVRAYGTAAKKACLQAETVTMRRTQRIICKMNYSFWGKFENYINKIQCRIDAPIFMEDVTVELFVPEEDSETVAHALEDLSDGKMIISQMDIQYDAWEE